MSLPAQTHLRRACPGPNLPAVVCDGRLSIDLGGTVAEVSSSEERWLAEVRARFGSFVVQRRTADILIAHTGDEGAMTARCGCLSVVVPGGRAAEIAETAGTAVLDGVLRTVLPGVIAPDLMVHGALLAHGSRGFLCCGVSGSGKSTIAGLFPEAALCDEMVRLVDGPAPLARSLPFWQARPGTVRLSAVFVLEHGPENRRTLLAGSEAIQELRRHVYWPVGRANLVASSFESLSNICQVVPVYRLAFRPHRSVWDTMVAGL